MPVYSGLEFLEEVESCSDTPPIIILTSFENRETRSAAERFGIAAIFDKPFDLEDFLNKVRALVPPSST